jgi:lysophospholipase L1-like esterase
MLHVSRVIRASALLAALACAPAFAQNAPAPAPATAPTGKPIPKSVPWEPSVKYDKDGSPSAGFLKQHESFLARGKSGPVGLLLLGDSITAGWGKAKDEYNRGFGDYQPANFGIGGDRTEHVLWRIANGELDNVHPKVVMLMIGTNNSGGSDAAAITKGVTAVVEAIRAKLPDTKILLLGIFPRGADPADPKVAAIRKKLADVNAELAKLDDGGAHVKYLDIGDKFLDDKGAITKEIMPDALHPTPAGYKIWVDAVKPTLDEMMK